MRPGTNCQVQLFRFSRSSSTKSPSIIGLMTDSNQAATICLPNGLLVAVFSLLIITPQLPFAFKAHLLHRSLCGPSFRRTAPQPRIILERFIGRLRTIEAYFAASARTLIPHTQVKTDLGLSSYIIASFFLLLAGGPVAARPISPPERPRVQPAPLPAVLADQRPAATERV
jgi:hypothetical protein